MRSLIVTGLVLLVAQVASAQFPADRAGNEFYMTLSPSAPPASFSQRS